MKEIHEFIIAHCGDPGKDGLKLPSDSGELAALLEDFQKQYCFRADPGVIQFGKMANDFSFLSKHYIEQHKAARLAEKEQRLFIAANSAMNGILVSSLGDPNGYAIQAVQHAVALLAELEKETSNQSTPQP